MRQKHIIQHMKQWKGTNVYNELTTDDFTLYDADGKACSIGYCYESFGIITNKKLLDDGTIMKVQDLHGENWVWRMNAEDMNADLAEKIGQLTGLYGRG